MASDDPLDGRPASASAGWSGIRLPDGSATDVIGWLEAVDADAVGPAQRRRRATRVTSSGSTIVVARRAPAAAGGPHPRRISASRSWSGMRCPAGWPTHEPLGEWTLRSAGGFTGRANSCLAVGDPGLPIADAADRIVAYAARARHRADGPGDHRLRAEEQALRAARLDRHLRADRRAGGPAGGPARERPSDRSASQVHENLEPRLVAGLPAQPAELRPTRTLLRMILDGNPPRAFASAMISRPERGLIAIARGHRQRRLARPGVDLDPRRASPAGLGDRDDDRTGSLGGPAGRPLRLPPGRRGQPGRPSPRTSGSASASPPLPLPGSCSHAPLSLSTGLSPRGRVGEGHTRPSTSQRHELGRREQSVQVTRSVGA